MPDPLQSAPALNVPEVAPASAASTITEVTPSVSPAIEKVGKAAEETLFGIQGPKEALGTDPQEEMAAMEAKMTGGKLAERQRDPKTGRLLPKDGKPAEKPTEADPVAAKTAVKAPAKPAKVTKEAPKPAESAPAKIKIGDQEMTAEEVAKRISDLEAKANAKEATKDPKNPGEIPQPGDPKAELAKKDEDFINRELEKLPITQEQFDEWMSKGDYKAMFREMVVKPKLELRKWVSDSVNRILEARDKSLEPILKTHEDIARYQTEHDFLEGNPEIKAHPQGLETYRKVAADMHDGYSRIQQKISQGTATNAEAAWAMTYEKLTPEEFSAAVAEHTKTALAPIPAQPPTNGNQPAQQQQQQETPKPKPQPRPLNGDRPGGVSRIQSESADARALREMNERQGIA